MTTTSATKVFPQPSYVIAEDAPLGVQLFPTEDPCFNDNFILQSVGVTRHAHRSPTVTWTYVSGKTRTFGVGEQVCVRFC